jgi:hypothetical protein
MATSNISFRSKPINLDIQQSNIDRENGVIRNIVLAQVGEAKGHGVHLNQTFLEKLVAQGNDRKEVSTRLGHPTACDTAMGKQVGFYHNFKVEGDKAIADLKVLKAAKNSPSGGNVYDWIFDMAEERPEHIMNSIVFSSDGGFQLDEDGKEVEIEQNWWGYDAQFEDEPIFIRLKEFVKSDLVEDGAATDSLFSRQVNNHLFAETADSFLDENPLLLKFLQNNPAKVFEYAKRKGVEFEEKGLLDKIKSLFKSEEDNDEFDRIVLDNQKLSDDLAASIDTNAKVQSAQLEMQRLIDEKDAALEASELRIKELEQLIEGIDLNHFPKTPAAKMTKKPLWHKDNF